MRITVVEDDGHQYDLLQANLRKEFPGAELTRIRTAKAFQESMTMLGENQPGIILIDVMIPWQTIAEELHPAPPEIVQSDYRHIGIHCQRWLTKDDNTKRIPVILYTELDRESLVEELQRLPPHVQYLRKDAGYAGLNRMIWRLTRRY